MKKLIITSGYFRPLLGHHIDYLKAAHSLISEGTFYQKASGDLEKGKHIVIVNNDNQVKIKGSIPFICEQEVIKIVDSLWFVDGVVTSVDQDGTVVKTLKFIHEAYGRDYELIFANGGDRLRANIEEKQVCDRYGINMVFGVGGVKTGSSSNAIEKAAIEYIHRKGWVVIQ